MTMEYDEEFELFGLSERGREKYLIRTLQEYGNGDIDPICLEQFIEQCIRTRTTDRSLEILLDRGGNRTYIIAAVGQVDTYRIEGDGWIVGEEFVFDKKEIGKDLDLKKGQNLTDEVLRDYLKKVKVLGTDDRPLFDEDQVEAVIQETETHGLKKYMVRERDKFLLKYFVATPNFQGGMSSRFANFTREEPVLACDLWDPRIIGISYGNLPGEDEKQDDPLHAGEKTVTRLLPPEVVEANLAILADDEELRDKAHIKADRPELHRIRPVFRDAEYALETPKLTDGVAQEQRLNFHQISKLRLNRRLRRLHREQKDFPGRMVEYPKTGCSPKGQHNISDYNKRSWRDHEYRSAILQDRKEGRRPGRPKQRHDLPPGLFHSKERGRYEVALRLLGLDGLRVIAHNEVEKKSRTAPECYEQLMEMFVHQAVRGNPGKAWYDNERLTAWLALARFGEDGLRTGSAAMLREIDDSDLFRNSGLDASVYRPKARRRFEYDNLLQLMKETLYRELGIEKAHPELSLEKFNPFWTEADYTNRYGENWETPDPEHDNVIRRWQPWVEMASKFIETHFDRSFPSEQYKFREMLSRRWGAHDKKSYRSKAAAMQRVKELMIHVISMPTARWVYKTDARGNSEWKLEVDWSTFDYFTEGIEALRDWIRMINEWKYSKSAENAYTAMSFEDSTIDRLRSNDWGGIWNPVAYRDDWSFWLLYLYAQKHAPLTERPKAPPVPERNKGEKKREFDVRLEAYKDYLVTTHAPVVGEWIAAAEKRVAIMGWAWFDKEPGQRMPHDGSLRALTAQKWADWLAMIMVMRGFNSQLGDGLVPDLDDFLKNQSVKVRNYTNESEWMESDEGATRDPQAVWGYLRGVLRHNIVGMVNYRLWSFRKDPKFLEVLLDLHDVKHQSGVMIRDQLNLMWEHADLKGIKRRLLKLFWDAVEDNVVHIRPLYVKLLSGLPTELLDRLQLFVRGLNRRSDRRVRAWAMNLSVGLDGGKRALSNVNKWLDDGYATNTGSDEHHEHREQEELAYMAWMNGQYDKAIWLTRKICLHMVTVNDAEEVWEDILSSIGSGLNLTTAREVADTLSKYAVELEKNPVRMEELRQRGVDVIKIKDRLIGAIDYFPPTESDELWPIEHMEHNFVELVKRKLGDDLYRAVKSGKLFGEMRAAPDLKAA